MIISNKTVALKTFYWITEILSVETTYSNKQFQKHADYFNITSFSLKKNFFCMKCQKAKKYTFYI